MLMILIALVDLMDCTKLLHRILKQTIQFIMLPTYMFYMMIPQLWTMYCEQMACMNAPNSDQYTTATFSIMDFWSRVIPGVLQLLSQSKVVSIMPHSHLAPLTHWGGGGDDWFNFFFYKDLSQVPWPQYLFWVELWLLDLVIKDHNPETSDQCRIHV